MQSNKSRDTKPELAVRRLLHARGLRYRVDASPVTGLRRRADVLFTRQLLAVFIDGCFWHGCPKDGPQEFKTNSVYWTEKIRQNKTRDADTDARLRADGWQVMRFWEHIDPATIADAIEIEARRVK